MCKRITVFWGICGEHTHILQKVPHESHEVCSPKAMAVSMCEEWRIKYRMLHCVQDAWPTRVAIPLLSDREGRTLILKRHTE